MHRGVNAKGFYTLLTSLLLKALSLSSLDMYITIFR